MDQALVYRREVESRLKPEAAERDTGSVVLDIREGDAPMADLRFRQDDKYRGLGSFPASVGNPMIMYFYESVVRDMAEAAGGSPFYIRNRVKDALVQPSDIVEGEAAVDGRTVETRTITLHPFHGDPNADRMQGFGDLALTVTMSEEVPGWYLSLVAEAPGEDAPVYRSAITFESLQEEAQ
ncbi:hypothetical protein SAMN05444340_101461 [Citreimonas salinaria]|uniref:Uncharacterized protein n=2 Tax=Citreimonas salinaria TaxID=321339 RepID=A0A1H3FHY1_9RHOB|nr:hypothetical protein SAMN05444340_101461 [Citreimonas salinaria]